MIRASGASRRFVWVALFLVAQWGCYGFAGGGLPPQIRTVAILPFDNQTSQPALSASVSDALREAIQNRLGLRPAAEATADAVVRGAITNYQPDIPISYQAGQEGNVSVTKRRVQITLNVEIYDQKQGKMLWQRSGLTVDGEYQPPQESQGRTIALAKLVSDIVDGAQSQW